MKIDKQYDAITVRVVPDLMVVRIVKNDYLALFPRVTLIADSNPTFFARLWNLQAEVESQHTGVRSTMRRDVFSRRED